MDDLENLGITELSQAYTGGATRPTQVAAQCLARIDKLEPQLGAFELVMADQVMEAAEAATRAIQSGHRIGPFHGVPFVLKDLIHVKGTITTGGANPYAARLSTETAAIARRLIAGGGLLLGKTKTVEVAFGPWGTNTQRGTPWNPWDKGTHRAPGGSSSGTGVSVAARLAVCGVGTDTGGSVRIPSAFCGLVGLKVTEGQLPLEGIQPLSHTLDTPGPMCRSATDAAIMYQTMAGQEPHEIDTDLSSEVGIFREMKRGVDGLVIGVLTGQDREIVDVAILDLYDSAIERLAKLGAVIKPLTLPRALDDMRVGIKNKPGEADAHGRGRGAGVRACHRARPGRSCRSPGPRHVPGNAREAGYGAGDLRGRPRRGTWARICGSGGTPGRDCERSRPGPQPGGFPGSSGARRGPVTGPGRHAKAGRPQLCA